MQSKIRIALIDLYDGIANEGIRAITESVETLKTVYPELDINMHRFDTRTTAEMPGLDYDIYLSSGGPGNPIDGEGSEWEKQYFEWVDSVYKYNQQFTYSFEATSKKKHVLFICHSFQMMCRYFGLGNITERHSPSFGILKVSQTEAGRHDPLFRNLPDPFYAGDFRAYQVTGVSQEKIDELGAQIIAIEKKRPHVPYERAVMGVRISDEMVGVQFHPEADPPGMRLHFQTPERKKETIEKHSEEKYLQIIDRLDDPDYLEKTHLTIIPNFFSGALKTLTQPQAEPTTSR